MHRQNHYYLVRSMKTFLKRSYFCDLCKIGYGSRVKHFCQLLCQMCRSIKCEVEFKVKCPLCKTDCNNQMCLKIHLEQICLKLRTCTYCSQLKNLQTCLWSRCSLVWKLQQICRFLSLLLHA